MTLLLVIVSLPEVKKFCIGVSLLKILIVLLDFITLEKVFFLWRLFKTLHPQVLKKIGCP